MPQTDIVIRLAGTAGEGALSLGEVLARAFAKLSWELMLSFSFDAEVRGEKPSFSQLRVSDVKPQSQGAKVDLLAALNTEALELNLGELKPGALVVYDGTPIDVFEGEQSYEPKLPEGVSGTAVPLQVISQSKVAFPASKNMAALGALTGILGLPVELVRGLVAGKFARKGDTVIEHNLAAFDLGYEHVKDMPARFSFKERGGPKLMVSGNQAAALGAVAGGCRFFAGYPITPATEVMEQLARDLPSFGGTVVQAEDELAALGMVVGASFAGRRAMTATSGPGLSLMSELLGLCYVAEVPAVVLDVQRGGPSTGLPTRPEQSDLLAALYGSHGGARRIVLAPSSVEECFMAVGRAQGIAERYQMPVVVLTDQFLAYRRETLDVLDPAAAQAGGRVRPDCEGGLYLRYRITDDGISPMSVPGEPDTLFTATGLEHTESGIPAYDAGTHSMMSGKRASKLVSVAAEKWTGRFGADGADIGVLAWGSVVGAAREAVEIAQARGVKAGGFYSVMLNPLPEEELGEFIRSVKTLIMPELNHTGQFARLIRERFLVEPISLALTPGGPFPVYAILDAIIREYGDA
jgi:2-oxoglutarate/2-oxoacid ferredoxin oxidoreductase subunit alpha